MATYSVIRSTHQTAGAAVADQVTITDHVSTVAVWNRQGTDEIYFTTDGTTPTSGGDNTYVVPAVLGVTSVTLLTSAGNTVIKLICASSQKYSVVGS